MTRLSDTYRKYLAICLLSCYLAGIMHPVVLECAHFAAHLGELVAGDFQAHSFSFHPEGHQHTDIESIAVEGGNTYGKYQADRFFSKINWQKKCPQISLVVDYSLPGHTVRTYPTLPSLMPCHEVVAKVPSPPPRSMQS